MIRFPERVLKYIYIFFFLFSFYRFNGVFNIRFIIFLIIQRLEPAKEYFKNYHERYWVTICVIY